MRAWVRQVDVLDVVQRMHKPILRASTDPLSGFTVAASPDKVVASDLPVGRTAGSICWRSVDKETVDRGHGYAGS